MSILHADHFTAKEVADLAVYALRQPGNVAYLGDLRTFAYSPKTNTRIWVIEDANGHILAEMPSLYQAIHSISAEVL